MELELTHALFPFEQIKTFREFYPSKAGGCLLEIRESDKFPACGFGIVTQGPEESGKIGELFKKHYPNATNLNRYDFNATPGCCYYINNDGKVHLCGSMEVNNLVAERDISLTFTLTEFKKLFINNIKETFAIY